MSKQAKSVDPFKIKDYATSIRLASEDKNKMAIQEREVQETKRSFGARLAQQVARAAKVGMEGHRMQNT
jgi:hypothetical protein